MINDRKNDIDRDTLSHHAASSQTAQQQHKTHKMPFIAIK